MPELPEVTTTVRGLQRVLPGLTITDVWTDIAKDKVTRSDFEGTVKSKKFFVKFKSSVVGQKVLSVERRAKNILINISGGKTILIHLKMTGHLIYGNYVYNKKDNTWTPDKDEREELHDPYNRFVHVVFNFNKKNSLAFCDARKFGKVTVLDTKTAHQSSHLVGIGPEPLDKNFTLENFTELLNKSVPKNSKQAIKTILMDQYVIAGIGNIYSDEMLWLTHIHPESNPSSIPLPKMKALYTNMRKVLNKGIDFGGDSMSDYRDIDGKRGNFQNHHNVYRKNKEECGLKGCTGVIIRKVIGGRSAHFCSKHQIKY
ncbi:MAG: bifunctional DNA-formamidopyrimidine glycosylase/DNA-(apurinic or apyrimidinic site) lyase [bacterium]